MHIAELGDYYREQLTSVTHIAVSDSPWRQEALAVNHLTAHDFTDTDTLLDVLHRMQRLHKIRMAGLENDTGFFDAVSERNPKRWNEFGAPPVDLALQHSLAQKIYNANPANNDFGEIVLGDGAKETGKWLVEKCRDENIPFVVVFEDADFNALAINHASEDGIRKLAASYLKTLEPVTKAMVVRGGVSDRPEIQADQRKRTLYRTETDPYSKRISSGQIFFTLTEIPSRKDAELDGIPYDDYIKLFFEMCDQPWDAVKAAQAHLIGEFNAASQVHITNSDGTDLTMSLVDHDGSHFTFCNSVIAKNVPGSEIFSAPRRDSLEGKIVSKGRFEYEGQIIENLTLEFEKGCLVRYAADSGQEAFERALSLDEGTHYAGEIGVGTNSRLKKHVINSLLVEKIGGSFHIALGHPYSYTEYGGVPVKVNNGGESKLHWDITTMLHGKEGKIYLDGRMIMDNGSFLDPKYDVLNRGWEAVPVEERPEYWRDPARFEI